MKKQIFIILFFAKILMAQQDTNSDNYTIQNNIQKDRTTHSLPVEVKSMPEESFWIRNEGALLGLLFGCLIAIFSVKITNYYNDKKEKQLNQNIYSGLLIVLKSELEYLSSLIALLNEDIQNTIYVLQDGEILALKKPFRKIRTSFLDEARNKILNLEIKETDLLRTLTYFINTSELINNDLRIDVIYQFYNDARNKNKEDDFISNFFGEMMDKITSTKTALKSIITLVDYEINKAS